ncbi:MAG: tryptophan 2,3-dioxygenase, partial [Phototrophicales bacterium]
LNLITDIDELLARWRYRHALLVQRMVGMSAGTGGSSGYGYLMETLAKHRIFTDFFALSSYMIPSKLIPPLPKDVSRVMRYQYNDDKAA